MVAVLHSEAAAKTVNMIFWYPGEAGSTEEAGPVLDLFFEKISEKIAPDKIQGKYFNTVNAGLAYIRSKRPVVGVISYAAWVQNRGKLGGTDVILATLPLPGGTKMQRYALACKGNLANLKFPIISSEPMDAKFIVGNLFPDLPPDIKTSSTEQILHDIKKIASGELSALAILTPTEAATFKKLGPTWKKDVHIVKESRSIPSARVVAFNNSWSGLDKFKKALLSFGSDQDGKDILNELRLKGFADVK